MSKNINEVRFALHAYQKKANVKRKQNTPYPTMMDACKTSVKYFANLKKGMPPQEAAERAIYDVLFPKYKKNKTAIPCWQTVRRWAERGIPIYCH